MFINEIMADYTRYQDCVYNKYISSKKSFVPVAFVELEFRIRALHSKSLGLYLRQLLV